MGGRKQVVVVAGASGEKGHAVARKFAARGVKVARLARRTAGLNGAAEVVRVAGVVAVLPACRRA